ncbi:MAG: hypothetical protein PGN07_11410 [Aeromicrobium erythreum]
MPVPRLSSVPALLVVAFLSLAGCGSDDERRTAADPAADRPEVCGYLDEATRTRLAGTKVPIGVDPSERRTAGLACSWTDSKLADATANVYLGGTDSRTWAVDLEQVLAGKFTDPSSYENFHELTATKDMRAKLNPEQACRLWSEVATAFDVAPKNGIVFATTKPEGPGERHVARAEVCRDGVFAELYVSSTEPIPSARAELVRSEVLTVWQRLKQKQAGGDELR